MASQNELSSINKNIMQSFNSSTTADENIGNTVDALQALFSTSSFSTEFFVDLNVH